MMIRYNVWNSTYRFSILSLLVLFSLVSCKKQEATAVTQTLVSVYNFSPTVATYDAYLGDTKLNTVALPFGGGTKYQTIQPGSYAMKFNISGSTTSIFTKTVTYQNAVNGSLYLIGKNNATYDALFIDDSSQNGSTDKSYLRFVNVCADAPAMDLTIAGGATITTNKAYKTNSTFVEVTPGTFTFNIKETTSGAVKTQIVDGVLAAGGFYTIAVGGNYVPANDNERPVTGFLMRHQ